MNSPGIPEHWSPEQAMAVYEFIEQLGEQLWRHYRLDFATLIGNDALDTLKPRAFNRPVQLDLFVDNNADDLPF